jgi:hypothetical protein
MPKRGRKVGAVFLFFILRQPGLELKISWLSYHVQLHALANAIEKSI